MNKIISVTCSQSLAGNPLPDALASLIEAEPRLSPLPRRAWELVDAGIYLS